MTLLGLLGGGVYGRWGHAFPPALGPTPPSFCLLISFLVRFFVSLVRLLLHPLLLLNPLLLLCVALLADLFAGLQILEDCYLLSIVFLPLL